MKKYVTKYSIDEEQEKELKSLMSELVNEKLEEISVGILSETRKGVAVEKVKKVKKVEKVEKKFASKKAENQAKEHGLSLEDFDKEKVGKKDVDDKIKERIRNEDKVQSEVNIVKGNKKVMCSGLTPKGEACQKTGKFNADGKASKKYCKTHEKDWQMYECRACSSDSSDQEESLVDEESLVEEESEIGIKDIEDSMKLHKLSENEISDNEETESEVSYVGSD